MSRHALLLVAAVVGCSTDASTVGVNGACTRTTDCDPGLSCVGGVCSPSDAGPSDGGRDANDSGAADGNAAD
ncbi:MAG TPA: hypothetical protein VGL81_09360 [Polyangiaceae bacterium]